MRRSREETAETRERIVTTAAREFKRHGILATGLADLMKAAGLTHGGFYKHFPSKDALVAEAAQVALTENALLFKSQADSRASTKGLKAVLSKYLSVDHRQHPESGCFFAALGGELAHSDASTRDAITRGLHDYVDALATHCGDVPPAEAQQLAMAVATSMIGAMIMSRAVNDPALSDAILKNAKTLILAAVNSDQRHGPEST